LLEKTEVWLEITFAHSYIISQTKDETAWHIYLVDLVNFINWKTACKIHCQSPHHSKFNIVGEKNHQSLFS
jgi:hypothetical protein